MVIRIILRFTQDIKCVNLALNRFFYLQKGEIKIRNKKHFILVAIMLMVILASGCAGQGTDVADEYNEVAVVNGESIMESEYQVQLSQLKQMSQSQGINVEENEEALAQLENQALETLINTALLVQEGEKKDIQVSQTEIDENIEEMKSGFEDEAKFEEALETSGIKLDELNDLIRENIMIQSLISEINYDISEDEISDEEIENIYEQQKQMSEAQGAAIPSLEELKPMIIDVIKQQNEQMAQQQAVQDYIAELREKSEVEILI